MTVKDMIYQFLRDIGTIDKSFEGENLPDTHTIVLYLNKAKDRFIRTRYLYGKSILENAFIIEQNSDDLIKIIKRVSLDITLITDDKDPYYGNASIVDLSTVSDYFHYMRSDVKITRTQVVVVDPARFVPGELINYNEIDQYLSTPYNHPILPLPKIVFQEPERLYIIHDLDTTLTESGGYNMTYMRRHKDMVDEYTRSQCYQDTSALFTVGTKIMITAGHIQYPSSGGIVYNAGDIITVQASQLIINFTGGNTGCRLDNYDTETLECELAEYTHEEIVRMAMVNYIDELKFKLAKKNQS